MTLTSSPVNSALWAAYGDAIGFITELRDAGRLQRAISARHVSSLVPWPRRVGGRFGPTIRLPAGCYSDDTQLRLSTCRAIRGDGSFDVEAFAKVELPVWLAYHLGAGRGTKAAARNLERRDVTWYSNFFDEKGVGYFQSGGNGAAMRIQPHVWADSTGTGNLLDVVRNALTTHGHPRGFLGAVFHAQCLAFALRSGSMPDPAFWAAATDSFSAITQLIEHDENLASVWLPTWEARTGRSLREAVRQVQEEQVADLDTVASLLQSGSPENVYKEVLRQIGGFDPKTVGSGTKTSLLASVLAYMYRDAGAEAALTAAANQLGSDTDSIATMAGALLGVVEKRFPRELPLDADYIANETGRLRNVAERKGQQTFRYPDLFHWRAPKAALDVVGVVEGNTVVAGLGRAVPKSEGIVSPGHERTEWRWLQLEFGQTILVKQRIPLPTLPASMLGVQYRDRAPQLTPSPSETRATVRTARPGETRVMEQVHSQVSLFESPADQRVARAERRHLDDLTNEVIQSGFDPVVLGRCLRLILDTSRSPIEMSVAFVAIVAKAASARRSAAQRRGPT